MNKPVYWLGALQFPWLNKIGLSVRLSLKYSASYAFSTISVSSQVYGKKLVRGTYLGFIAFCMDIEKFVWFPKR